nr:hypothetical protein [Mycoplasmopsis bovis]
MHKVNVHLAVKHQNHLVLQAVQVNHHAKLHAQKVNVHKKKYVHLEKMKGLNTKAKLLTNLI